MWNSNVSNCKQEWGPWSRLGGETTLASAGNHVWESELHTAEIAEITDLSFQFVLMPVFSPEEKKKKGSNRNLFVKILYAKLQPGTDLPGQREATMCPLIMEISLCITDPSMEGAERCTVSVQLQQLLQNQRVCILWNRRIASMTTWHKPLLCKATSEWVGNSLSSCSFLLRLVNSASWQG